jgi:hypothetical protein
VMLNEVVNNSEKYIYSAKSVDLFKAEQHLQH